jgi:hypothetical protein
MEVSALKTRLYGIAAAEQPVTCRGLFYRMVSAGHIAKTEAEYNNVVIRLVGEMREEGSLPWSWITDGTRLMRVPEMWGDLAEALESTKEYYRRDLWRDQDVYAEVWCEKDSLSGVIFPVTAQWGVPLMITRGFSSSTFLHGAAETITNIGKKAFLSYVGDYDPSGLVAWEDIQRRLRRYAPDADITFERIAITPEQVKKYRLPTRPTKRTGTHAKNFKGIGRDGDSIEADALSPQVLRELVSKAITRHIDQRKQRITEIAEESEREILGKLIAEARLN